MSDYDDEAEARREDDRRQSAVDTISGLYPPDSDYEDTRELGKGDLIDALCAEWRSLPVAVLEHIAQRQHMRDHGI